MYKDSAAAKGGGEGTGGVGELLLITSLTCDGLTGAVQERMKAEHGTKSGHMMLAMNKWSVVYLSLGLLATGEGLAFLAFLQRHPGVLGQLLAISVASALGKFFTVLASVVLFGNSLVGRQWLGCFFVFTGIFLDGLYGKQKAPAKAD